MARYIFGTRNNIHIIDLAQTVPMLHQALQAVSATPSPRAAASCSSAPSARRRSDRRCGQALARSITSIRAGSAAR